MSWMAAGAQAAGSLLGAGVNLWEGSKNRKLQKEFAQQGIRWKVADAQAAGIHPLYALGAQTHSFQPFMTGAGSELANMGQDVSRAIGATQTAGERAHTQAMAALELDRAKLENELLRSQIARANAAPNPPLPGTPYLIDGQSGSGALVRNFPLDRVAPAPGQPSAEPGAITGLGYERTPSGWAPVPSGDVKQRIEDMLIPQAAWTWRNYILPSVGFMNPPSGVPLKKGYRWVMNPYSGFNYEQWPKWEERAVRNVKAWWKQSAVGRRWRGER
ncbi:MAG: putative minor capsid protein [Microviridae sp. ctQch27]|nr:MAG: putative minor capsid protein [Microviridae sp. ctQch27]